VKVLGRMAVFPIIPARISRLYELAFNLWWTWNADAVALYAQIQPEIWQRVEHNAVRLLAEVDAARLEDLAKSHDFLAHYDRVITAFDAYMRPKETWFSRAHPEAAGKTIAYFCAEFGLHESLPIYSGGLGILAGDHCKEASDLGLPFVGVGFLYPQGYFRQRITRDGRQEADSEKLHFSAVPATAATDASGREVMVSIDLPGRRVFAKVWRIQVGRIPLFLMDTDVDPNSPNDRTLSARLYAGDHEMRIAQEIMLGIGGVRTLRALGIDANVWHMNEGHSAFLGLERCRELVQGLRVPFDVAREIAASNSIFTTHTPVAAGNDVFSFDLVDRYFGSYWPQLGLDTEAFHNLGRENTGWGAGFSMTVLALKLSSQHNGVSRLHGEVSRKMWRFLWPEAEEEEVPITSITNGVHTASWLAPRLAKLYSHYLGAHWYDHLDEPKLWRKIEDIPDGELWEVHQELKAELIEYVRERVARQRKRHGESAASIAATKKLLSPTTLTLGFARRFATYKRATLLFRNPERLEKILNNPERPVQVIFAGKAHPADHPGQDLIRQVYDFARDPRFAGKIVLLEDYDIDMARRLVSGCDVWLNNPVRPHEASGTSGQKASLNGLPNCSIRDGWWEEGYDGHNGWAFGEPRDYQDDKTRDDADAAELYETLENEIAPLYYDRGLDQIPHNWVSVMKEAIRTIAPAFSMRRMVKEYVDTLYMEALRLGQLADADNYRIARDVAEWKRIVRESWPKVGVRVEGPREGQLQIGQPIEVRAYVTPGGLRPSDLKVELIAAQDQEGVLLDRRVLPMDTARKMDDGAYCYQARLEPGTSGMLVYGVRVLPTHPGMAHPLEVGLARWA
jgi:starch phosphorylase